MSSNRRIQTYIDKYSSEFDFIRKSHRDESSAFCCICNCDLNIAHGGRTDIITHTKTVKHLKNAKRIETSSKLKFLPSTSSSVLDTIRAELLFTNFLLEHNLPISAADHATKLFPAMFPNSVEAKKYSCGRTKTTQIVKELASESTKRIVSILKTDPFTVATDGSNDVDNKNQLYPIVVTFFDKDIEEVCCRLLSLPSLEGDSSGQNIAKLVKDEFQRFSIPWENCLALSCDNANVMIGKNKGVGINLKEKQPNLIVWGCMCHLLNLAAEKGSEVLPLSFDELLVDIFYYLKKSSKRQQNLKKFQDLYNAECKQILKHCATRWLSLGKCLGRLLDQWNGVLHFFKSESQIIMSAKQPLKVSLKRKAESSSDNKVKKKKLCDDKEMSKKGKPVENISSASSASAELEKKNAEEKLEKAVLNASDDTHSKNPVVCREKKVSDKKVNKSKSVSKHQSIKKSSAASKKTNIKNDEKKLKKNILSREERIFLCLSSNLYHSLAFFLKNVLFVFDQFNISLQSEAPKIHKLKSDIEMFFKELLIRFIKLDVIKASVCVFDVQYNNFLNHKDNEDISVGSETSEWVKKLNSEESKQFYEYVKEFFCKSCDYIIKKFPIYSDILHHAEVLDISKREEVKFSSVKFFLEKFPSMVCDSKSVFDAFDNLESEFLHYQMATLPEDIINLDRPDIQWAKLSKLKDAGGKLLYEKLSNIMCRLLVLPHSNAACERIFSIIKKNKTTFRSSMDISTLQSILIAKSNINNACYAQKYDVAFLKKAKSATYVALNNKTN